MVVVNDCLHAPIITQGAGSWQVVVWLVVTASRLCEHYPGRSGGQWGLGRFVSLIGIAAARISVITETQALIAMRVS